MVFITTQGEMIMIFKRTRISGLVAGAMLVMSGSAMASGFALIEQSGSGLGNAFAGGAASAEDASTIFYNPAGMSRLSGKQIVVAGSMIKPSAKFSDNGSSPAAASGQPLGGNGGDAGSWTLVPNAYFAMDVNPQMKFGLGINAPFGLKTDYEAGWAGRFQALKSEVKTINVNPTLSYQLNEMVSLGLGLDYQKINAELTNNLVLAPGVVGAAKLTGSDSAWGYNLGALFQVNPETRVGLAYRSSISYKLSGDLLVTDPTGATVQDPSVTADIKTPDTFSLSGVRQIDSSWDVMGDITWTGWSKFKELRVVSSPSGATAALTNENWKNTYRISLGANHHFNEQWMARAGVAFDQAPVSDTYRTARIPDNDRTWLSVGGQYKPNKEGALDFGYAHLFVKDTTISNNNGSAGTPSTATVGNLVGTYKNSVDILSVQYAYSF
jgi:long-chain fatty acid transport protein